MYLEENFLPKSEPLHKDTLILHVIIKTKTGVSTLCCHLSDLKPMDLEITTSIANLADSTLVQADTLTYMYTYIHAHTLHKK